MNRDFVAVVLLTALVFTGLYEGAYYLAISDWMHRQVAPYKGDVGPRIVISQGPEGVVNFPPDYALGEPVTGYVFAPAHWLDRQIRPSHWQWAAPDINSLALPLRPIDKEEP